MVEYKMEWEKNDLVSMRAVSLTAKNEKYI